MLCTPNEAPITAPAVQNAVQDKATGACGPKLRPSHLHTTLRAIAGTPPCRLCNPRVTIPMIMRASMTACCVLALLAVVAPAAAAGPFSFDVCERYNKTACIEHADTCVVCRAWDKVRGTLRAATGHLAGWGVVREACCGGVPTLHLRTQGPLSHTLPCPPPQLDVCFESQIAERLPKIELAGERGVGGGQRRTPGTGSRQCTAVATAAAIPRLPPRPLFPRAVPVPRPCSPPAELFTCDFPPPPAPPASPEPRGSPEPDTNCGELSDEVWLGGRITCVCVALVCCLRAQTSTNGRRGICKGAVQLMASGESAAWCCSRSRRRVHSTTQPFVWD